MQTDEKKGDRKGELVSLQNISSSKLLNYVVKAKLKTLIDPDKYAEIETQLKLSLGKDKISLKDMKQYLSKNEEFMDILRQHQIGADAFTKYLRAAGRLQNIDRNHATQVRRTMTRPRSRYLGCLASKIQPDDYADCLDKYDSPKYDKIGLIPNKLRQRVYDNGDQSVKALLGKSVEGRRFSDLPSGLRLHER